MPDQFSGGTVKHWHFDRRPRPLIPLVGFVTRYRPWTTEVIGKYVFIGPFGFGWRRIPVTSATDLIKNWRVYPEHVTVTLPSSRFIRVVRDDIVNDGSFGRGICTVPPLGWYCTREKGHEGPCAAIPVDVE